MINSSRLGLKWDGRAADATHRRNSPLQLIAATLGCTRPFEPGTVRNNVLRTSGNDGKRDEELVMPKTTHHEAAEHHETAAKAHRTAAEHHEKGSHDAAHEHSTKAHTASAAAHEHSTKAHSKSAEHAMKK
jgi:hypothetical protein